MAKLLTGAVRRQQIATHACPVCRGSLDLTDQNFYPCSCRHQICVWCYQRITTEGDCKCPKCKKPYDTSRILKAQGKLDSNNIQEAERKKRQEAEREKRQEAEKEKYQFKKKNRSTHHQPMDLTPLLNKFTIEELRECRILLKDSVILGPVDPPFDRPHMIKKRFEQFGEISKITFLRRTNGPPRKSGRKEILVKFKSAVSAKAISEMNNVIIRHCNGNSPQPNVKQGTQKMVTTEKVYVRQGARFCSTFLDGHACTKSNCAFVHYLPEASAIMRPGWESPVVKAKNMLYTKGGSPVITALVGSRVSPLRIPGQGKTTSPLYKAAAAVSPMQNGRSPGGGKAISPLGSPLHNGRGRGIAIRRARVSPLSSPVANGRSIGRGRGVSPLNKPRRPNPARRPEHALRTLMGPPAMPARSLKIRKASSENREWRAGISPGNRNQPPGLAPPPGACPPGLGEDQGGVQFGMRSPSSQNPDFRSRNETSPQSNRPQNASQRQGMSTDGPANARNQVNRPTAEPPRVKAPAPTQQVETTPEGPKGLFLGSPKGLGATLLQGMEPPPVSLKDTAGFSMSEITPSPTGPMGRPQLDKLTARTAPTLEVFRNASSPTDLSCAPTPVNHHQAPIGGGQAPQLNIPESPMDMPSKMPSGRRASRLHAGAAEFKPGLTSPESKGLAGDTDFLAKVAGNYGNIKIAEDDSTPLIPLLSPPLRGNPAVTQHRAMSPDVLSPAGQSMGQRLGGFSPGVPALHGFRTPQNQGMQPVNGRNRFNSSTKARGYGSQPGERVSANLPDNNVIPPLIGARLQFPLDQPGNPWRHDPFLDGFLDENMLWEICKEVLKEDPDRGMTWSWKDLREEVKQRVTPVQWKFAKKTDSLMAAKRRFRKLVYEKQQDTDPALMAALSTKLPEDRSDALDIAYVYHGASKWAELNGVKTSEYEWLEYGIVFDVIAQSFMEKNNSGPPTDAQIRQGIKNAVDSGIIVCKGKLGDQSLENGCKLCCVPLGRITNSPNDKTTPWECTTNDGIVVGKFPTREEAKRLLMHIQLNRARKKIGVRMESDHFDFAFSNAPHSGRTTPHMSPMHRRPASPMLPTPHRDGSAPTPQWLTPHGGSYSNGRGRGGVGGGGNRNFLSPVSPAHSAQSWHPGMVGGTPRSPGRSPVITTPWSTRNRSQTPFLVRTAPNARSPRRRRKREGNAQTVPLQVNALKSSYVFKSFESEICATKVTHVDVLYGIGPSIGRVLQSFKVTNIMQLANIKANVHKYREMGIVFGTRGLDLLIAKGQRALERIAMLSQTVVGQEDSPRERGVCIDLRDDVGLIMRADASSVRFYRSPGKTVKENDIVEFSIRKTRKSQVGVDVNVVDGCASGPAMAPQNTHEIAVE